MYIMNDWWGGLKEVEVNGIDFVLIFVALFDLKFFFFVGICY